MNIITVDDHEMILLGLKVALKSRENTNLLYETNSAEDAWEYVLKNAPIIDVVITDMSLPEESGVALCKKIKQDFPDIKVVVFTMNESPDIVLETIAAKANGLIKKGISNEYFIAELEKIIVKGSNFSPEMLYEYRVRMNNQSKRPKLTVREKQILELIVQENTSEQIAQQLNLSKKTIDAHRANMMQKFDVKSSIGLIKIALESKFL